MQELPGEVHINLDELVALKIPAIKGSTAKNNTPILLTLAEKGPLLKYELHQEIGGTGTTILRRVNDLASKGYISPAGTRIAKRGRQQLETQYGLTWKGLIACLYFQNCRKKIVSILRNNPLLDFQEKDIILVVFSEVFDEEYLDDVLNSFFQGYILSNAPPIESIVEKELIGWVEPIVRAAPHFQINKEKTMNLLTLLDNRKILEYVKEKIIPKITVYKNQIYETYQLLSFVDEIGQSMLKLNVEDKPSKRVEELLGKLSDSTWGESE